MQPASQVLRQPSLRSLKRSCISRSSDQLAQRLRALGFGAFRRFGFRRRAFRFAMTVQSPLKSCHEASASVRDCHSDARQRMAISTVNASPTIA